MLMITDGGDGEGGGDLITNGFKFHHRQYCFDIPSLTSYNNIISQIIPVIDIDVFIYMARFIRQEND